MLKDHEIAEVFPLLSKERLESLGQSILTNGLRHPIQLFEEKILDGRNRYRAMRLAGYEPRPQDFVDFEGDWDAAVRFVVDENLERRDLQAHERAFAADALANLEGKGRPRNASRDAFSQAEAAQRMGTSRESVQRARKVRMQGAPELLEAARTGEVGLRPAAELTKLPVQEQRAALAGGRPAIRKAVAEAKTRPAVIEPEDGNGEAIASARRGQALVRSMLSVMRAVAEAAQALSSGRARVSPAEAPSLVSACGRIRAGVDWVESLATGSPADDAALRAWLEAGEK